AALAYKEEESKQAFQNGRLLFLRNWPYAYVAASAPESKVAGKVGAVPLPGADGPGTSVLGGSNLAVSSQARHPDSAARLIAYLPTRRASVPAAGPRPKSPHYDQVSLVVQAVVHDAMTGRQTPEAAVRRLATELAAVSSR